MDQEDVKPRGVCAAFGHLETASVVAKEVQDCEERIASEISYASDLKARLSDALRQHSNSTKGAEQTEEMVAGLMRALPKMIETAREHIDENRLLSAHAILMELEDFRDGHLLNLTLLESGDVPLFRKKFESCFEGVKGLAGEIARQIRYTCSRALQLVRGHDDGSVELVNALRIIEREESRDAFYAAIKERYVPTCRPREWKAQLFVVLRESVHERIDACQFEDRSINKEAWLCKYLEVCRRIVLDDLTEVHQRLARCFPPDYEIYQRYLEFYHDAVSKRIEQIADDNRLEKNELVQLLTWVRAYSDEVITDPIAKQRPILTSGTVHRLSAWFVQLALRDIRIYLSKLSAEHKGHWYMGEEVEKDGEGSAYSKLPSLLFGLLDDNVALANKVAPELGPVMVDAALHEYFQFANSLVKETTAFKGFCMRDRAAVKNYTSTVTAIANDFDECSRSTEKLRETTIQMMEDLTADRAIAANDSNDGRLPLPSFYPKCNLYDLLRKLDTLKEKWLRGVETTISILCDELMTDTAKHLGKLGTTEWLGSSSDLDSFLVTVQDYAKDYGQLRPHIQSGLMEKVLDHIAATYILNVALAKLTLTDAQQRGRAAKKLAMDAGIIDKFFQSKIDISVSGEEKEELPVITAFGCIADVLESRDKEVLPLSVSLLVKDTGLASVDILSSLIQSRGDISTREAKELAGDAIRSGSPHSKPSARMMKLIKLCESNFRHQSTAAGRVKQKHF